MTVLFVIPAKAGTHLATNSQVDEWVPAFAGMTIFLWVGL